MLNDLTVSVIIPVYNQGLYLVQAIESVLAQTEPTHEIIVIDDGSSENIPALLSAYSEKIRYIHQMHQGAATARNVGVMASKCELLAFLDADDLWLPDKIKMQIAAMRDQGADLVFTHIEQFVSDEIICPHLTLKHPVLPGYCPSTLLVERKTFLEMGEFDPHLRVGEFIEWYLRAQPAGCSITMIERILARRRMHRMNHGSRDKLARSDYLKILNHHIEKHVPMSLAGS